MPAGTPVVVAPGKPVAGAGDGVVGVVGVAEGLVDVGRGAGLVDGDCVGEGVALTVGVALGLVVGWVDGVVVGRGVVVALAVAVGDGAPALAAPGWNTTSTQYSLPR